MQRAVAVVVVGVFVLAGCGSGGSGEAVTTTTSVAPPTSTAAPGLTVKVRGLTESQGLTLVVTVFEGAGGAGKLVGTACAQVDADPWSGGGVVSTAAPDNPCDHNSPYGVPLAIDGAYAYTAGTYTPGQQTPGRCVKGEVTINGATELSVDGTDLGTSC